MTADLAPPPVLCRECGHTRADHTADMEQCRGQELVVVDGAGRLEWCSCRGWIGRPIIRPQGD